MNQSHVLSVQLKRGERIAGWIYLPFYLLLLSIVITIVATVMGYDVFDTDVEVQINLVYGLINFIAIAIIFHSFLIRNLANTGRRFGRFLLAIVLGFLIYFIGTIAVGYLIDWLDPSLSNLNDDAIDTMAGANYQAIFLFTVALAPIVEETLFRGLIFSSIQKHHRILAYIVCMIAFASIHVVGYIGQQSVLSTLLSLIQYFPAGIALCWAYERADSIWAPIVIHCAINAISMLVMQTL